MIHPFPFRCQFQTSTIPFTCLYEFFLSLLFLKLLIHHIYEMNHSHYEFILNRYTLEKIGKAIIGINELISIFALKYILFL